MWHVCATLTLDETGAKLAQTHSTTHTHTRLAYTQQRLEVLASSVLPPIFSSTATDDRVLAASLFE